MGEDNVVLCFCKAFPSSNTKPLFVSLGLTQKPEQKGGGGGPQRREVGVVSEGESFFKFDFSIKKMASVYGHTTLDTPILV